MTIYKVEIYQSDSDLIDRIFFGSWIVKVSADWWSHLDFAYTREQAEAKARRFIQKESEKSIRYSNRIKFEVEA